MGVVRIRGDKGSLVCSLSFVGTRFKTIMKTDGRLERQREPVREERQERVREANMNEE